MLAQASALAESAGLPALLRTEFPDADVARLVGADGVHEFPLALLSLGAGPPALRATGEAATGTIDASPLEFPPVTTVQRAGAAGRRGGPWPDGARLPGPAPASEPEPLDDVILRRGSTRRMVRGAALSRAALEWSLPAALRRVAGRPDPQFVAVHAVD